MVHPFVSLGSSDTLQMSHFTLILALTLSSSERLRLGDMVVPEDCAKKRGFHLASGASLEELLDVCQLPMEPLPPAEQSVTTTNFISKHLAMQCLSTPQLWLHLSSLRLTCLSSSSRLIQLFNMVSPAATPLPALIPAFPVMVVACSLPGPHCRLSHAAWSKCEWLEH